MRKILWTMSLALAVASARAVSAEPARLLAGYSVRQWTVAEGLPENLIVEAKYGSDGFLWCATPSQILRFDGVRFGRVDGSGPVTNYAGNIRSFQVDRQGALWIGARNLHRLRDVSWRTFTAKEGMPAAPVLAVWEGADEAVWLLTATGLCRYNGRELMVFPIAKDYPKLQCVVRGAAMDRTGATWLATSKGLLSFRDGRYHLEILPSDMPANSFERVSAGRSGRLWAYCPPNALYRLDRGMWMSVPGPELTDRDQFGVTAMLERDNGELWVGTDRGLFRMKEYKWRCPAPEDPCAAVAVKCLTEDREGNIWLGTEERGLWQIRDKDFEVYRFGAATAPQRILTVREKPQGGWWVSVAGGGLFEGWPGGFAPVQWPGLPNNVSVTALLPARDGSVWIGTMDDGLFWQPKGRTNVTRVAADKITALAEDRAGQVWAGTAAGLMLCEEQKRLTPVEVGRDAREPVNALVVDRQGIIWAGYETAGLLRLFCGKAAWFAHTNGLPGDSVRALCVDPSGVLWIGTDAGLARWDNERRSQFTTAHGLTDNTIQQVVGDDNGHLWLGSRHGLMRLNQSELAEAAEGRVAQLTVRVFDRASGMPTAECVGGGAVKTRNGKVCFPTLDGLVVLDPDRLAADAVPLPVVIEEVWANGRCVCRPHPPVPLIGGRRFAPLDFQRDTRDVTFRFTLPAVSGAEHIQFKYRLDGRDPDWSAPADQREVRYPQLPPGQYRFRVIACNRDGVWGKTEDSVAFSISAPLWQQPLVIGGVLLAGVVVLAAWRGRNAVHSRR